MDFNALFSQLAGKGKKSGNDAGEEPVLGENMDFQALFEQITSGKGDNPMKGMLEKLQYLQATQAVNVEPDPEADEFIDALNGDCAEVEDDEFIESLNAEI